MKIYELTYLISSDLSEEEAGHLYGEIISLIQEEGGISVKEESPFKKKLAYAVKKQFQAYLSTVSFQLMPEKLSALEKKIKTKDKILRYLLLTKPPVKKMKFARISKKARIEKPTKEKKVELKEIEKKLEEILNEPQ